MKQTHTAPRRLLIILLWLLLWQLASLAVHNSIILVSPPDVVRALLRLSADAEFYRSVLGSLGRIALGFVSAFLSGILLGAAAFRFPLLREFLQPPVLLMKAVPVASFVILALIWIGSANLSVFISFLVVFPMIYVNTIAGLESTDLKLREVAQVFHLNLWRRIRLLYVPALRPHLASACEIALGMSWKSGVAAEVIGIPTHSIGEKLYLSKIWLETADLFAWTLVIILISAACEKAVLAILRRTS